MITSSPTHLPVSTLGAQALRTRFPGLTRRPAALAVSLRGTGNQLEYGLPGPWRRGDLLRGGYTQAQGLFPTTGSRANYQNAVILLSDGDATASGSEISSSLASNQCTQAVNAAHALVNTYGTWVYAIAYDAQSGGCNGDSGYNACSSLQHIASSPGHIPDPAKFYSDSASARNGCSSENSASDLSGIFGKIGMDFLTTRLVPWGTQLERNFSSGQ